jgi:hypothetical protein
MCAHACVCLRALQEAGKLRCGLRSLSVWGNLSLKSMISSQAMAIGKASVLKSAGARGT